MSAEPQEEAYPYIRKWGKMLSSMNYYIDDQIELARKDKAPANAIYKQDDGAWATTNDIESASTLRVLGLTREGSDA